MRSKLAFLLTGMVALSLFSVAMADDHDRRDDHRSDDHGRDHHDRRVWSHEQPRPHYMANRLPPPMRHEWRPYRPSYHHVWISGCWRWRDSYADWVWVDGFWDLPPSGGVVYVAPRYYQSGTRVEYVDGGWCEPGYANDGTTTGVVLGGVAGGIIGHQSKRTGVGVLLGALVGGVIGHEADQQRAEERAARIEAERSRAAADAERERQNQITVGQQTTDQELAAAQERARVAKEKLAAVKASRASAQGRAQALERANAEADAAEAELNTLSK